MTHSYTTSGDLTSHNSGIYLRKLVLSKTFDPLPELVTGGAIIPPNP